MTPPPSDAEAAERWRAQFEGAVTALHMIRDIIEQVCPAGVLPSAEAVLKLYGPEPIDEDEAICKAIVATVERLTAEKPT